MGEIFIRLDDQGLNILDLKINIQKLRQKVGMVFQTPNILPVSIFKNITMPLRLNFKTLKKKTEQKVQMVLKQVQHWEEVKKRLKPKPIKII